MRIAQTLRSQVFVESNDFDELSDLWAPGGIRAAVQPIFRTSDLQLVGHEALARMAGDPPRPPDFWLGRAEALGNRARLELACLEAAARLGIPPDNQLLFVNLSPSTLANSELAQLLDRLPERLVLEISECEAVGDYAHLRSCLAPWLQRGARVAIDDTGAGYSSLRHVVELAPDFLKLDRAMVSGLDSDPVRLALVRAVVAFAREVGTSVIGEGVETVEELAALRDAGVHFVQGYLVGRPSFEWALPAAERPAASWTTDRIDHGALLAELGRCDDASSACGVVAERLFRKGTFMPSVYLEQRGSLRCLAQRGLWQVLDGMPAGIGVTGRAFSLGMPIVVDDVRDHADYLEAIPGVRSEICVPIRRGERVLGALNAESFDAMPAGTLELLSSYAEALAKRLDELDVRLNDAPWHAVAQASLLLSSLRPGPALVGEALRLVLRAASIDSGAVVLHRRGKPVVVATHGPLSGRLAELGPKELDDLQALVSGIRSCYTAGDPSDHCFVGTDSLREGGARALLLLPLWAHKARLGTLVAASSKPRRLDAFQVEPLEVLADHLSALLAGCGQSTLRGAPGCPDAGSRRGV